jgi:hypothetical protein
VPEPVVDDAAASVDAIEETAVEAFELAVPGDEVPADTGEQKIDSAPTAEVLAEADAAAESTDEPVTAE